MLKLNRTNLKSTVLILLIISILFYLFKTLIINDPYLGYDDEILLKPLLKINDLTSYFKAIQNGNILDLQPIRDISYLIDIYLQNHLPFYSFHLTNFLLWLLTIFYFYKILCRIYPNSKDSNFVYLTFFMFAFFPPSLGTIAWVSARKHILSTLFISICTEETVKTFNNKEYQIKIYKILFFYIAAILSQPINIFWPLWALFYFKITNYIYTNKKGLILLFISMISVTLINIYYFSYLYPSFGYTKFLSFSFLESLSRLLRAIGSYFILFFYPNQALPTPHSQYDLLNLLGLFLFTAIIIAFIMFKKKLKKHLRIDIIYIGISYFILHLIPVLWNSNIFASDSYLLNASIGIFLIIPSILKNKKNLLFIGLLYVANNLYFSFHYLDIYTSGKKMWSYTYLKSQTPEAIKGFSGQLIHDRKFNDAYVITSELNDELTDEIVHVRSIAIYLNEKISIETKEIELKKLNKAHPSPMLFLALIYYKKNNLLGFRQHMQQFLLHSNMINFWPFKKEEIKKLSQQICYLDQELNQKCNFIFKNQNQFEKNFGQNNKTSIDSIDVFILEQII